MRMGGIIACPYDVANMLCLGFVEKVHVDPSLV